MLSRVLLLVGIAGFWMLAAREERETHLTAVYGLAGVAAWYLGVFALGGLLGWFLGGLAGQAALVALFIARKTRKEKGRVTK